MQSEVFGFAERERERNVHRPPPRVTMQEYDRVAELAGALQARFDDVRSPLTATAERELRQAIFAYADALKALDLSPERVIVSVKRLANEAGIYGLAARADGR